MKLLTVAPSQLTFLIELDQESQCPVQLHNPGEYAVAFKVKTTAPKRYCVKPNIGVLRPGERSKVVVFYNKSSDAPLDGGISDRFLIQCVQARAPIGSRVDPSEVRRVASRRVEASRPHCPLPVAALRHRGRRRVVRETSRRA